MAPAYDPAALVKEPTRLIDLCREVIAQIEIEFNDPLFSEKEAQLREIAKAVERLEKTGVPVPDMLRAEKTRLAAELSSKTEGSQALAYLSEGLEAIVAELNHRLGKSSKGPDTKKRKKRSRTPKTDKKTLRIQIINALKKHGGRARISQVFDAIEKQLEEKFLPGDLEFRQDGKTVVWKNNVQWERLRMARDGSLRNDSPNGIWELSEEIK